MALVLLSLSYATSARGVGTDLASITGLAAEGAPDLALAMMDRYQPGAAKNPQVWMRWERERVRILRAQDRWEGLARRLTRLPPGLPAGFRIWAETRLAAAEVELGRGAVARHRLLRLIWVDPDSEHARRLPGWRRLLIRAYLREGRVDDAHTAMLRYQLDYGGQGEAWRNLRARVLIRAGRPGDAADLLDEAEDSEGRVLSLLARSRAGRLTAAEVREAIEALLAGDGLPAGLAFTLWASLAAAAGEGHAPALRVEALERALALRRRVLLSDLPVSVGPTELWGGYAQYAEHLANRRQLLVGSDGEWQALAEELQASEPRQARALYAYLALRAERPDTRARSHTRLAALLAASEDGLRVLRELYLEARRFPDLAEIPEGVRYGLVDEALGEGDIGLASRLLRGLSRPPSGTERLEWQLRRARVFILGGEADRGIAVLREVVSASDELSLDAADRLAQVLFDLQTLGEQGAAYDLFEGLLRRLQDPKRRREVLFWMADSRRLQGRHREAARLYLLSALSLGAHSTDPWAQSARYQAAESLAKAGLSGDARRLYRELMRATRDPARRAVLRRAIGQLRVEETDHGGTQRVSH